MGYMTVRQLIEALSELPPSAQDQEVTIEISLIVTAWPIVSHVNRVVEMGDHVAVEGLLT